MTENELQHHQIFGAKWGQRNGPPYPLKRSQMTRAERKQMKAEDLAKKKEAEQKKAHPEKYMSNAELKDAVNRIKLENEYRGLTQKGESALKAALTKAAISGSARLLEDSIVSLGRNAVSQIIKNSNKNAELARASKTTDATEELIQDMKKEIKEIKTVANTISKQQPASKGLTKPTAVPKKKK